MFRYDGLWWLSLRKVKNRGFFRYENCKICGFFRSEKCGFFRFEKCTICRLSYRFKPFDFVHFTLKKTPVFCLSQQCLCADSLYFGGDLQLMSMEGYGTDAFLHLRRLGDVEEPLPEGIDP